MLGVAIGCAIGGLILGFFWGGLAATSLWKRDIRSGEVQLGKDRYGTYKYRTEP